MAESKIERVARAIAAVEGYDVDGLRAYAASSSVAKADYEQLLRKSRAAIAEMRKPTDEMVGAMLDDVDWDCDVVHAYQVGIDAALNEQVAG